MSLLNTLRVKLGLSNTASHNFTLTAEADDGSMKLARGNPGATTQDILTVDASGAIKLNAGLGAADNTLAPAQKMLLIPAKATTSGTYIDFSSADGTGIPPWAKRITVMFNGVSLSGTSNYKIQIGSGVLETSGYISSCSGTGETTGFLVTISSTSTDLTSGIVSLNLLSSNTFVQQGLLNNNSSIRSSAGTKTLSGTLDRIRITTVNGTDTFDAGSVALLVEGY